MNKKSGIDPVSLKEDARKSGDHEAFQVLIAMQNCRIGVGSVLDSSGNYTFFMEALVTLCKGLQSVDLFSMDKNLLLLKQLKKRGYALNCEEDGCISSELTIGQEDLANECEAISKMTKRCLSGLEVIVP